MVEYKNFRYPYSKAKNEILRKTICGLLNCKGGIIFIGIEENLATKKHKVVGQTYSEYMKEEILKDMRHLVKFVEPDILMSQKMKISFIPVKSSKNNFVFQTCLIFAVESSIYMLIYKAINRRYISSYFIYTCLLYNHQ